MTRSLVLTLTIFLALLLPSIVYPTIIIFYCYRLIVSLVLKIQYGDQFGGLMNGNDSVWAIDDNSKGIIHSLITITSVKDVQYFTKIVKNILHNCLQTQPKLSYTRKKFLGYHFFLKSQNTVDDFIKVIRVECVLDKAYLENFISSVANEDLPDNDSALWELLIFDKTTQTKEFVVLFRVHHSLADGFSLTAFFLENFSSRNVPRTHLSLWKESSVSKSWLFCLWSILYGPANVIAKTLLRPKCTNSLHGPSLSGEKVMVWTMEEEEMLIPMIKMIKNKIKETRFSDVLLTAISASLVEFYSKKAGVPDFVTCVIPVPSNLDSTKLTNSFCMGLLDLPLKLKCAIVDVLEAVKVQTRILRHSPDFLVNYWFLRVVATVLPEPLLKVLIRSIQSTMAVSILPGPDKLRILDGDSVKNIIFWIPHRGTTGVGLSVFSYDNRLQIGLSIDKVLVSKKEEAQVIVDGVLKHILQLYASVIG